MTSAEQSNLSTSRATEGGLKNTTTIPAVSPHTNLCSDNAKEPANHSSIAPPAQTTRRSLILNSIVSAVAIATATAIPNPDHAAVPIVPVAASFPELVVRLIKIRERWSAQRESDEAYSEKIGRLFLDATGVSQKEYFEMPIDLESERVRHLTEACNRILKENPDGNDPVDRWGCSTAWPAIQEEVEAVASAMLSRTPQSITDLAWQAEALLLAEAPFLDDHYTDFPMLPKLFENLRVLAGSLAIPEHDPRG